MTATPDPLAARTPEEMLSSCRESAEGVAGRLARWDSSDPMVRCAVDSGLAHIDGVTSADLQALGAWRPAAEQRRNSVYLDSATVVTAARLLAGERSWLTPLTLWDLATFADRVIMSDQIYYVGEHLIPATTLNKLLGSDVFISVPPLSRSDESAPSRVYGRNLAAYSNLVAPIVYRRRIPAGTYWADAIDQVVDTWSVLTGRRVRPHEALVPCEAQGWFTPKVDLLHDPYCDDLPMSSAGHCEPVLGDMTFRAYASQSFANVLGIPYAPATVRMPFRYYFCKRSWELEDRLRSVEAATEAYRQLARESDLVLPVFLAVALADAQQPEDVWLRLAELRLKAGPFRKHRVELDESLSLGEVSDTSRRLLAAVRSEALKLTDLFGFGYKLIAQVLGRLAQATPPQLPDDVSTMLGIIRSDLPADVRQRLWWWFFRPELRFLTEVRTQSRQMTNAIPMIGKLWDLPPSHNERFRKRFEQLSSLRIME